MNAQQPTPDSSPDTPRGVGDGGPVSDRASGASAVTPGSVSQDGASTPPAARGVATESTSAPNEEEGIIPVPVRRGMSRITGVAIALGATALTVGLLARFADIVAPVFLAVNLLIAAYPIYTILTRIKVPRVIAAITTGLAVLLVLLAGVAALVWSGTSMVRALGDYSGQFTKLYQQGVTFLGSFGFDEAALTEMLKTISPSNVVGVLGSVVSNASGALGIIVVILVAMVFMVMDLPSMNQRMAIADRLHPAFHDNVATFVHGIRQYWLVTTIFGAIVAVLDGGVLILLGVPLPLVWAVLAFITNYIPNIGFVIGMVPPALLALVEKGPVTAIIVVVAYSVMNFVIQSIIQPKFSGEAVGITPTVSFISLLLWTAVFGALGALIALPFTLMVKAMLLDSDPKTRWINVLISSNPDAVEESL